MKISITGKFLADKIVTQEGTGAKSGKPYKIVSIALSQDGEQQNAIVQLSDALLKSFKPKEVKDGTVLTFIGKRVDVFNGEQKFNATALVESTK